MTLQPIAWPSLNLKPAIDFLAPIHVSNVAFYDSKSKSAVKLGYKVSVDENGKKTKVRVNKKTGAEVDSKKKK